MRFALHTRTTGFSLLEMIMVVIILAIVAAIGSNMLSSGLNGYFTGRDLADADWQGRLALERIAGDLRSIRSATAADLSISPASQIAFVNKAGASISYTLSGNILVRNGIPLADGITNLSFSYIRKDGKSVASTATEVYYIAVAFTVNINGLNQSLRSLVHPRNIL